MLYKILNRVDEKNFAHHLKEKCNYLAANQLLALASTPDLSGRVTMEIRLTHKSACVCVLVRVCL